MYWPLISFFISLLAIMFMVGRKLVLLKNGNITTIEENNLDIPNLKNLKQNLIQCIKKYEHITLVTILRFYIKTINFLKTKYKILKTKIQSIRQKKGAEEVKEKVEVSKFLKMISEYKHKIREIKHKIREEENL